MEGGQLIVLLSDDTAIPVDASVEQIEQLFGRSMTSACDGKSVEVFVGAMEMTEADWAEVRRLVKPANFGANQRITSLLSMTLSQLAHLPQRVYGGTANGTALYLSLPVNFKRRPDGRLYALLSEGERLWKMWVNSAKGDVEIEAGEIKGHFVR